MEGDLTINDLKDPYYLKGRKIKNRFLRSATAESMVDFNGHLTDQLVKLYYDLAVGGTGVIITGVGAVDPQGRTFNHQLGVWDDEYIPDLRKRLRFLLEVYSTVREAVGDEFPILWKINTDDFHPNGQGINEYAMAAGKLAEMGEAPLILGRAEYQVIAERCNQCFQPLVTFLESLTKDRV
ncbi:hypothetical protein JCM15765_09020 [Paradesulfitobacterium aromaticivorans]